MALKTDMVKVHDQNNLASAHLILEDVERNGGEDSLMVKWARMVIARLEGKA